MTQSPLTAIDHMETSRVIIAQRVSEYNHIRPLFHAKHI